jgi:multidrug efflux pump subunit AcrA (membrane-fusion protein)
VDTDDSITASSGTLLVQLEVDNQNGTLIPGEYTEVHFAMPTNPHALLIPASALIFRQSGLQVAVIGKDNHAVLKPVTIATDLGTQVEIGTGLDASDRVIDNPPDSIANGDAVRLADVHAANLAGAPAAKVAQQNSAEPAHG